MADTPTHEALRQCRDALKDMLMHIGANRENGVDWVCEPIHSDEIRGARAALAAADAALSVQAEPVGVLIRGEGGAWSFSCGDHLLAIYSMPQGTHSLYATPQPPAPVPAAPLTEAQIAKIEERIWNTEFFDDIERQANREFARAIERAHNITGGSNG